MQTVVVNNFISFIIFQANNSHKMLSFIFFKKQLKTKTMVVLNTHRAEKKGQSHLMSTTFINLEAGVILEGNLGEKVSLKLANFSLF